MRVGKGERAREGEREKSRDEKEEGRTALNSGLKSQTKRNDSTTLSL